MIRYEPKYICDNCKKQTEVSDLFKVVSRVARGRGGHIGDICRICYDHAFSTVRFPAVNKGKVLVK